MVPLTGFSHEQMGEHRDRGFWVGVGLPCPWRCDVFTVTIPCLLRPLPGSDLKHQGEETPTCGQELHPSSSHFCRGSATETLTLILKFL